VAPEVSAVDEVNEVAPEVDVDEVNVSEVDVNEVDVDEVNVNEVDVDEVNVNKVNEESAMNEDGGEVCDAKEEMRKGKPPEVLQRFGLAAKVQVEEFGMKEVKNLEDDEEVAQIDDSTMKVKEESRNIYRDPGKLIDAKAQTEMFNVKVEVMLSGNVNAKVLFDAMSLFNLVRLYTSEVLVLVLVARNAARFVDVNPLSSRSFAESFLPILSDYG